MRGHASLRTQVHDTPDFRKSSGLHGRARSLIHSQRSVSRVAPTGRRGCARNKGAPPIQGSSLRSAFSGAALYGSGEISGCKRCNSIVESWQDVLRSGLLQGSCSESRATPLRKDVAFEALAAIHGVGAIRVVLQLPKVTGKHQCSADCKQDSITEHFILL